MGSARVGIGHSTGQAAALRKRVVISLYDDFPQMALFQVQYTNHGTSSFVGGGMEQPNHIIFPPEGSAEPAFGRTRVEVRIPSRLGAPPEIRFSQENYLGMNSDDYGGGTPVIDVWRRDVGIGWDMWNGFPSWFHCQLPGRRAIWLPWR